MNITKLIVKKLFGRFDYEIDFSNKKLLIITAPNGYGKSTILKIIKSFVDSDYIYFINENFQSIEFTFDNNLGTYRIVNHPNLNDTPIFFTSMLTGQRALDLGSYERLVWHIGFVLDELNKD